MHEVESFKKNLDLTPKSQINQLRQEKAVKKTQVFKTLGPNFRNFLGRSLEDFFSKESMRTFKTSLENVFGRN